MANETKSANPGAGPEPQKGDAQKKLAGKFESSEALEKGYEELEKYSRGLGSKLADLEKKLEENEQRWITVGPAQEPQAPAAQDSATEFLTKFYSDPEGTLGRYTERITKNVQEQTLLGVQALRLYDRYLGKNPDLSDYEDIFQSALARLPKHLQVQDKLDRAGEATRKIINQIRQSGNPKPGTEPNPDTYVEGPSGGGQAAVSAPEPEPDDSLAAYVNERRAMLQKKLVG